MSRGYALPLLLITLGSLLAPAFTTATDYQQCTASSTCTIGEFLYADDYTVLPGQTCTLTAKNPDGTSFLTSAAMTSRADGWYSYDATLTSTTGLYTATMCCTPPSGTMCLDKSFEVNSPVTTAPTAADIWSYSSRTMTSYGTLVNDIWNASTRSLTSFGSVVSDVWNYSGRTMTSFGSLVESIWGATPSTLTATSPLPSTLQNIISEQTKQRELLEKLVNAPIISLSLDEGGNIPDLESKLDESKKQANVLYDNISSSKSRLMALDTKWNRLSKDAAISEITAIASDLQSQSSLVTLGKLWEHETLTSLNENISTLKNSLASLLTATSITKTALAPSSLMGSLATLSDLETTLGDNTNSSDDPTFYGHLASVSDRNSTLLSENQKISAILENLNGQGVKNSEREVNNIKSRLLTLNQFPGGESLTNPAIVSKDTKLNLKNILFSLQALVGLNTQILAMNVGDPIRSMWLEEGSIIFRAVITNPSTIISQSVPLKFYLPREVKTEDIITLDPTLSTTYDSTEEALYASGTYDLKPKETKVVFVEIEDIWQLSDDELHTLRTQADNLLKPLANTAYYSQGTILKSDIDVTLDKVLLSTGKAVTPENKIRAYREAKLELTKVTTNMDRLEDIVAQASGTGSVFGFVGGVQTVAVWGIILVVVAGFVFLSLYFKKLNPAQTAQVKEDEALLPLPSKEINVAHLSPLAIHHGSLTNNGDNVWKMPAIIALSVVLTASGTIFLSRLAQPKNTPVVNQVITSPIPSPSPTSTPSSVPNNEIIIKTQKDVLGAENPSFKIDVPVDSSVNIRNKASSDADIVMTVKETVEVYVFKESGDWSQIGFKESDLTKGYWVSSQFIVEK